ncbi:DNA repair protein RecO [Imhoffiella purpurea]|uniref:DNA repair protein RecO n=1 Tax=Imhoffiella purpurea TaxID=1249627 RepID=W9V579_9GAMM|nr:DNA repair protein RecO [Imhoffiella purpurea]EXJ14703.1 DNA recombination and repair protein RecO [Imhoffiella purpurea]
MSIWQPSRHGAELSPGFVLHRRDYSNTSLLVELFVEGRGRLPAIAKGARRPRNPASALLQPFQPLWLGVSGRGEVRTLTRVEGEGPPLGLSGEVLFGGFYLNELLMRLLGRDDPHDRLFGIYRDTLVRLAEGFDLESGLRRFELDLLGELGYGLTLDREIGGHPVSADSWYLVEQDEGVRRVDFVPEVPLVSGGTLLALASGDSLVDGQRRESRTLLRRILAHHLGERPLRSRELYRQLHGSRSG